MHHDKSSGGCSIWNSTWRVDLHTEVALPSAVFRYRCTTYLNFALRLALVVGVSLVVVPGSSTRPTTTTLTMIDMRIIF